jgi:hypothetical protein
MATTKPFPWVMIGACVIAVAAVFGHPWWGVLLALIPVLFLLAPAVLAVVVLAVFMLTAAVAYVPVLIVRLYRVNES